MIKNKEDQSAMIKESLWLLESKEHLELALDALVNGATKCAVYYAYTSMLISAKAFLWRKNIYKHTHSGIISGFNAYIVHQG